MFQKLGWGSREEQGDESLKRQAGEQVQVPFRRGAGLRRNQSADLQELPLREQDGDERGLPLGQLDEQGHVPVGAAAELRVVDLS